MKKESFKRAAISLLIFVLLTVMTMTAACSVEIKRDGDDEFSGEYVEADNSERESIAQSIFTVATAAQDKNLCYESEVGVVLSTSYSQLDLGAKLKVLYDGDVTLTYFSFGAFGDGKIVKREYFIYYVGEQNTTYYNEVTTSDLKESAEPTYKKYKKSGYKFDVYEFTKDKGFDFNFFGSSEVRDLSVCAMLAGDERAKVYTSGSEKIKIVALNEDEGGSDGYDGCAYYVLLKEDGFSIKVVMTYTASDGSYRETDKVIVITSTDEKVALPADIDKYEEAADANEEIKD